MNRPITGDVRPIERYVIVPACYVVCIIAFFTDWLG